MELTELLDHIGERWIDPQGRIRTVTRCYTDDELLDESGQPYLWIEFGTPALTYIYSDLPDRGWRQA